jgi:hypothetical protein
MSKNRTEYLEYTMAYGVQPGTNNPINITIYKHAGTPQQALVQREDIAEPIYNRLLQQARGLIADAQNLAGAIDLTPTWRGIIPLLLAGIESGTDKGRAIALAELARMADAADKWNAHVKAAPQRLADIREVFVAGFNAGTVALEGETSERHAELDWQELLATTDIGKALREANKP